jgi:hypothetical protein
MNTEELRIYLRTVADTTGAKQTEQALKGVQRTSSQMGDIGRFALRAGAAFGIATSAAEIFTQAIAQIPEILNAAGQAFVRSERLSRGVSAAYGQMAGSWQLFADQMSASTGQSRDAFLEAALSARTLSQNYKLSTEQTRALIKASADLASIRGIGVAEAFERVQSAIRGEAEASEYLGLTLNDTFLKNQALNGSLKNTFERMTDQEKAQVRLNELLRQSAQFAGIAAQGANSLEGAQKKATISSENFSRALGTLLAPALTEVAKAQTWATDELRKWVEQWGKVPTAQELRERAAAIEKGLPQIGPGEVAPVPFSAAVGAQPGESGTQALQRGLKEVLKLQTEVFSAAGASATERAASARADDRRLLRQIALEDQVNAAVRDATAAMDEQTRLQQQAVDLAAEEARIRLEMLPAQREMAERQRQITEQQIRARQAALPAQEALEDMRFAQQRAQLISQNRNVSAEQRIAARRELRGLGRALPGAELAALEAGRGVTLAGRAAERFGMEQQLFEISTQRQLEQITQQQTTNQLLGQIAAQQVQAIELTINLSAEDFQTQVFKQLVEAEKQAQGPTVVKLSGVRR